jgi:hypothetical protein
MNVPKVPLAQNRAASGKQSIQRQPEPEAPATFGQKLFLVVLYGYMLSLVWLVLSHHWYGLLPKWLDPH